MAKKSSEPENFWQELKRRKVIRITTVYSAAAFVILQLVDIIAQPLQLPQWTLTLILVLLVIGLIITIIVSWIYDITPAGVRKTNPASAAKHSNQTTATTSSVWKIATYLSSVIIVALITFNFISRRNLHADSKLEKSIAILPFRNDSPSDTNSYFINGLMEKILNNLQMVKELRVISRTSVEQYRNTTKSIPEIAKEQDVNFIVEGSGQKFGNNYSISVQLIKAEKENHLWGKSFEKEIREIGDIMGVQSEIAQSIAAELKATITPEEKQLIEKVPTTSLTANDFYQRGREEHQKYWSDNNNRKALEKAENYYQQALYYDPTFAQAYAGLAQVYWTKQYWGTFFTKNFLDSVKVLSDIALKYDNKLSEAYLLKGSYYQQTSNSEQADKEYDKAIKYNPNDWMAYYYKSTLSAFTDLVKVLYYAQKAISLNHGAQLPQILQRFYWAYRDAGFPEKSKNIADEILKLNGDSAMYYFSLAILEDDLGNLENNLEFLKKVYAIDSTYYLNGAGDILFKIGECLMYEGKNEESLKYFKRHIERRKAKGQIDLWVTHRYGYEYWVNGFREKADYYFKKQIEYANNEIRLGRLRSEQLFTYYDLAGVYAFLGEKNKAFENLRIFNQKKIIHNWMVLLIRNDPLFNSIRGEPEFQKIVNDLEAKYQLEHERVKKWLEEQGLL